ncbi:MAG TPA: MFS transporter [Chloroflexota bacterium]
METIERPSRPWLVFAIASVAQFMVVLDASIMNVALPTIQRALHFSSQADLQWVINIYVLTFGGFLLLGGRAGDLFGRRRLFMAGLVLFSVASLAGGLAQSSGWLIAARGVQGLGGAIISPIALTIVTDTIAEGAERNRAIGIFGSLAGAGGAAGVLLGGILTSDFGWQWVLFVNVPVGIIAATLSLFIVPETYAPSRARYFDLPGAVSLTAGLILLVYGLVKAPENGWASVQTIGFIGAAAILIAAFIVIELRSPDPLVRLSIFRMRSLSVANMAGFLTGAGMFAMFFFISLYLQLVLHYSAIKTGFAYLPLALMIIVAAGVAGALVTRFGFKPILVGGLGLAAIGLGLLTQIRVHGLYQLDVLPASLVIAAGLGFTFVPLTIAAVQGVKPEETGLASGVINTSLQIGGALGLAVLSTISTSRFNDLIKTVRGPDAYSSALVGGFHYAFLAGGIFLAVGAILVFLLLPNRTQEPEPEPMLEIETVPTSV